MSNFSKFSKIKFYNFLNAFTSNSLFFLFFYFKAFFISFAKAFLTLLNFQLKPLNQIHQMQGHICTIMLLNLMMSFNSMKILFSYIS